MRAREDIAKMLKTGRLRENFSIRTAEMELVAEAVEQVMKAPIDAWTAEKYEYAGQFAGSNVVMCLDVKEDVTPYELFCIQQLRSGDIHGNYIAFIIEKGIIRHFEERRFPVRA
jgi:hypothetical protein